MRASILTIGSPRALLKNLHGHLDKKASRIKRRHAKKPPPPPPPKHNNKVLENPLTHLTYPPTHLPTNQVANIQTPWRLRLLINARQTPKNLLSTEISKKWLGQFGKRDRLLVLPPYIICHGISNYYVVVSKGPLLQCIELWSYIYKISHCLLCLPRNIESHPMFVVGIMMAGHIASLEHFWRVLIRVAFELFVYIIF